MSVPPLADRDDISVSPLADRKRMSVPQLAERDDICVPPLAALDDMNARPLAALGDISARPLVALDDISARPLVALGDMSARPLASRVTVVVLTHERRDEVLHTLARMQSEQVPIIVADNASADGTASAIALAFPEVQLLRLPSNLGAAGRNIAVCTARTPYVAFCDDDTWWAPDALARACKVLDAHPHLAAVTARVLVEPGSRDDPTNARMAESPLANPLHVPGRVILGCMAGACMMRRAAFLAAGGYEPRLFLGMEERLLALDLATAGWTMAYLPDVIVHHAPSRRRESALARKRRLLRNRLWCAWLRLSWPRALAETQAACHAVLEEPQLAPALARALRGAPWVWRERRVVPEPVETALAMVTADGGRREAEGAFDAPCHLLARRVMEVRQTVSE